MAAVNILKTFHLRHTNGREAMLNLFLQRPHALAHADVEQGLGPNHDRVTIYRTLRTFLDKGLLHKVLDDEGNTKYALCREACTPGHHHHNHVHFKCDTCGHTTCLNHTQIPNLALPKGYTSREVNLLILGVCQQCNV